MFFQTQLFLLTRLECTFKPLKDYIFTPNQLRHYTEIDHIELDKRAVVNQNQQMR